MSHFTVLVIGDNIDEKLAPFQENNMGDCPKQFLKFNDTTDEKKKEYEEKTSKCFVDPSGKAHHRYDSQFAVRQPATKENPFPNTDYVCPAGWTEREVPYKELYPTFEAFVKGYHEEEPDPETGHYGYWENPNAKWDWYLIGGRWTGFFKPKPGCTGKVGRPGTMCDPAAAGFVDQIRKGDIDIEAMRLEAAEAAAKTYDLAMKVVEGTPPHQAWDVFRDELTAQGKKMDEIRDLYHKQPRVVAWQAAEKKAREDKTEWPFGFFESGDMTLRSREKTIQLARDSAISTHAVLKDGQWFEKGSMGWWGIVSDEKDQETWLSMFAKLIDELPDDTLLTVVDCHI